jgi:hypothetical protein
MIGANKIAAARRIPECHFYFRFSDGVFYWRFNEEELKTFEKGRGGRSDREGIEESDYFYIPINNLSKL